ncbi:DUF397 domain-containing protein [Streptomyces sp. enrichment culture]|uniref:DUF397 domain-containing protein n=1 Tax=Streptomyces sp. enrichment culture TaxID=1795815 RepID=UPI003F55C0B7
MWFTSSYSNGAGGECIECAFVEDGALVRDTKVAQAHTIAVGCDAWRSFVQAIQRDGTASLRGC